MELSGCVDECRRTANFYAALRCYEVFGLASVQWIGQSLRLQALLYWNLLEYLTAPPAVFSLQTGHKKTCFAKTLSSQCFGKSKQPCRNVCIWSTSGQCAATSPWILQRVCILQGHFYIGLSVFLLVTTWNLYVSKYCAPVMGELR